MSGHLRRSRPILARGSAAPSVGADIPVTESPYLIRLAQRFEPGDFPATKLGADLFEVPYGVLRVQSLSAVQAYVRTNRHCGKTDAAAQQLFDLLLDRRSATYRALTEGFHPLAAVSAIRSGDCESTRVTRTARFRGVRRTPGPARFRLPRPGTWLSPSECPQGARLSARRTVSGPVHRPLRRNHRGSCTHP